MSNNTPVTVHMIGNAHLDPVWLWHWQRGADECLATCRAACDLLDDYPEVVFTRGEAWVYEQVRTLDPELFERIRGHIQGGRWAVVNGWWVQADTNLPTAEALLATARLGQEWFREHLGLPEVPVGYLVDSFGHSAALPEILRQAGQRYFVMMRPMEQEKHLPSSLFRWRGAGDAEVLTYRLSSGYLCNTPDRGWLEGHIRSALAAPRPDGVHHVMCFYGVGNHGGGPTRKSVEWIRAHRDFAPGVRLEFSSPQRYFAAVEPDIERIPVVHDELQMHAIGCYSVCGALKRELRQAELAAADAEALLRRNTPVGEHARELDEAWKTICFNQFHDIVPGSSTAEAIAVARQQVGGALDWVERITHQLLRRDPRIRTCPHPGQRIHAVNRASQPWSGLVEFEVWLDWQAWNHHVVDAAGRVVPHQRIEADSVIVESWGDGIPRLLLPLSLGAGEATSLRLVPGSAPAAPELGAAPRFVAGGLENGRLRVEFGPQGITQIHAGGEARLKRPVFLAALADGSDTWSHDCDRYSGPVQALGEFGAPQLVENGPLRATVRLDGRIGSSGVRLFVSLVRDAARVDVRMQTNYCETMTVLKASVMPVLGAGAQRRDRIAGGWWPRACDGREYPVHHALTLEDADKRRFGVLFPDSFAADVAQTQALRVTLLRNSVHAYSSYARMPQEDIPALRERFGTDEGPQALRFALALDEAATEAALENDLVTYQRPPWIWDDFHGRARLERFE